MAAELFRHMESRSQNRGGGGDLEEMSSVQLLVAKSHHFAKCSKIEQSLPQIVTRRKKWSTSACSGWPRGFSLVVQVSGGALTRTSSVAPSIKIKSNFSGK